MDENQSMSQWFDPSSVEYSFILDEMPATKRNLELHNHEFRKRRY